ncbi:hypothetical protein [Terrarubrum flagellatum]|uniref:hypothetical protein n=1 Tax=Terrirubrum flagellatum TaxID=2895980 RepID=UPI00314558F5
MRRAVCMMSIVVAAFAAGVAGFYAYEATHWLGVAPRASAAFSVAAFFISAIFGGIALAASAVSDHERVGRDLFDDPDAAYLRRRK